MAEERDETRQWRSQEEEEQEAEKLL